MKDALIFIISSITEKPDKVIVTEEENEGIVNFSVTVDKDDMGKVIGKGGKVIKSIRNLLKILAIKNNKKVFISLTEISE